MTNQAAQPIVFRKTLLARSISAAVLTSVAGTGVVGFVGVSGMPQREDHAFLVEVLRDYLG